MYNQSTLRYLYRDSVVIPNHLTESIMNMRLPIIPAEKVAMLQRQYEGNKTVSIDYDKLGRSVAKHVGSFSDLVVEKHVFDADGYRKVIQNGNNKRTYLDNRYKTDL